jgi:hypothetical protein
MHSLFSAFSYAQLTKQIMDRLVQAYNNSIKALVPVLQKRSKASYITVAIALIIAQRLYSYFRVPKHLRGFPKLPYFGIAKSLLTRESPRERAKKYVLPIIDERDGFYIVRLYTHNISHTEK